MNKSSLKYFYVHEILVLLNSNQHSQYDIMIENTFIGNFNRINIYTSIFQILYHYFSIYFITVCDDFDYPIRIIRIIRLSAA